MLHLLLIVVLALVVWRLLSGLGASSQGLIVGLRRLGLVLAILVGGTGALIALISVHPDPALAVILAAAGFLLTRLAMAVVIWILRGFLETSKPRA